MINLDEISGDELWAKVKDGSLDELFEIVQEIEKRAIKSGGWNVKDVVSEEIIVGNGKGKGRIRTPKKQPFEKLEIAIDATNYNLLFKTSQGYRKTGRIINTLLTAEE